MDSIVSVLVVATADRPESTDAVSYIINGNDINIARKIDGIVAKFILNI